MKTRNGFVSNSSSSSFVVAFPKEMEVTPKAVHEYLFKDQDNLICYDYSMRTKDAAERICEDMLQQTANDRAKLFAAMSGGSLDRSPDYKDFLIPEAGKSGYALKCDWSAYEAACDAHSAFVLDKFMRNNRCAESMNVYTFEYSDNEGDCVLEHGDVFCATPHIQISRH